MIRIVRTLAFALLFSAAGVPSWALQPTKYAAKVPSSIQTPDTVETRIGTLKFFDGLPNEDTVQKVYDNIDFARGVRNVPDRHAGCVGLRPVQGLRGRRG
ncbi:hypothetical protein LP421_13695 [Rhizobium sp. RCAM05350]|nr:hypothetical protein LP421_13695 [Rhizobium sp. RCAM05350]